MVFIHIPLSLLESLRAHHHVVGMLRFMSDINHPSLPTLFFFFCSCVYFCLHGPISCISFYKLSRHVSVFSLCSSGLISAFSVLVSVSVFMALSTEFHSINSPDNSPLPHSVLPVLFLPFLFLCLFLSLWPFQPYFIP